MIAFDEFGFDAPVILAKPKDLIQVTFYLGDELAKSFDFKNVFMAIEFACDTLKTLHELFGNIPRMEFVHRETNDEAFIATDHTNTTIAVSYEYRQDCQILTDLCADLFQKQVTYTGRIVREVHGTYVF